MQEQIKGLLKATSDTLEMKTKEQMETIVLSIETINQRLDQSLPKKDFEIVGQLRNDLDSLNENLKKNQTFIDNFIASQGKKTIEKPDFKTGWETAINESVFGKKEDEITSMFNRKGAKLSMDLKVGNMLISSVTGDAVQGYNSRQGLLPSQSPNFRDLLPTTPSPTGSFVTYRETGSTGSISAQTEGNAKTQIDYAFTEMKAVSKYISGWVKFSKQLMYALPFLMNTLPRILLRDFYKKENDYLYTTIAGNATGNNAAANPTPTVDIEELVRMIGNQRNANFDASVIIVDWLEWSKLILTKPNDYNLPAASFADANGNFRIAGVPVIGASWAQTDHMLLLDSAFYERVETESLRVEFSYEDSDNFEKNLVTARVECFEEINRLRDDAAIYRDFGNS